MKPIWDRFTLITMPKRVVLDSRIWSELLSEALEAFKPLFRFCKNHDLKAADGQLADARMKFDRFLRQIAARKAPPSVERLAREFQALMKELRNADTPYPVAMRVWARYPAMAKAEAAIPSDPPQGADAATWPAARREVSEAFKKLGQDYSEGRAGRGSEAVDGKLTPIEATDEDMQTARRAFYKLVFLLPPTDK